MSEEFLRCLLELVFRYFGFEEGESDPEVGGLIEKLEVLGAAFLSRLGALLNGAYRDWLAALELFPKGSHFLWRACP